MEIELKEFNQILYQTDSAYHEAAVKVGLSDSEFIILYILCEEGDGCNQSVLYRKSGSRRSTINSAIRKMEQNGFLYLKPGEGRNTRVFLTERGHEMAEQTVVRIIGIENEIFRSWTKQEREQYIELNRRYLLAFLQHIRQMEVL